MIDSLFKNITDKISAFEKKENRIFLLKRLFNMISVLMIIALVLIVLESIFRFNSNIRTIIFSIFISLLGGETIHILFSLYMRKRKNKELEYHNSARRIGDSYPEVKDELLNALQIAKDENYKFSELTNAAFRRIYNKIKGHDFSKIAKYKSIYKEALVSGISLFLFFILLLPTSFNESANRLLNFNKEYKIPRVFDFKIIPGNSKITKGNDLLIKALPLNNIPNKIGFYLKSGIDSKFNKIEILHDSTNLFKTELKNVRTKTEYYFSEGDYSSDKYTIEVIDRPIIQELSLEIYPPSYSRLKKIVQKDNGNITALPGSRVKIRGVSSKELGFAQIIYRDSSKTNCDVNGKIFSAEFNLSKNDEYFILIKDSDNIEAVNPIVYSINLLVDEYPLVEIINPQKDIQTSGENFLSVTAKIGDDYGFKKLVLKYKLESSLFDQPWDNYKSEIIKIDKKQLSQEINYAWDIPSLFLGAEDVLSFYLEVFDNDIISGPKSAKSKILKLRVPSINELFSETDTSHKNITKEMEDILKESEKLEKELKKINNNLKNDKKELSWEEKQKIEKTMKGFEDLQKKVDELKSKVNETKEKLSDNNLLSEETLKKYNDLQKMMDEMSSDELKKAFQRMQKSLDNLSKQNAQNNLENFKINEEAFKQSIERTMNLLKRIQIEQKVDEMIKRSEELTKEQDELINKDKQNNGNKSAENANQDAKKQNKITKDLENFEEQMKKLDSLMEELDDMPKEELKKLAEELKKQGNQELSKQAQKDIKNGNSKQALQKQQQISENMKQMMKSMQSMQQMMQQKNQMKVMADMMKMINELLQLSKKQENLRDDSKSMSNNSSRLNENAREQNNVMRDLQSILQKAQELSQKTFAITPEMGKALGDAMRNMQQSINAMQNQNSMGASKQQNAAMASLNEAANQMQHSMQSMMQQGGGQGMMSMMQQMQQLSQQQMMLNKMTQAMMNGELSQEQMQQMQKLAQEQQMIQKSLDQLNKEAKESGRSKKLASNLDKIVSEMNEVISGLKTEKLNDDLIKQQDKILSKMLDAQRSVNERDFEKQRKSNSGELFTRETPPEILFQTEEGRNFLRDELLKASDEGYSKDFQELIRKYFEQLENSKNIEN